MKNFINLPTYIRDRDYILDTEGNYLRIIGDSHSNDHVISFVKYFPSEHGMRCIDNQLFGYNTFVANSFSILKDSEDRFMYSEKLGTIITVTPHEKIKKYFSCRQKVKDILCNKDRYLMHPVGKYLVQFLQLISDSVDLNCIGITGSFLFNAEIDKSDIDLVCYGKDAYENLSKFFQINPFLQRYENELANELYRRRMTHMATIDFNSLIMQESRKLQAVIRGTKIHINCQPLRLDGDDFMNMKLVELGLVACIVEIQDDSQGFYSPAFYKIKCNYLIKSIFSYESIKEDITVMLSLIGTFSQSFKVGDKVYLEGKLVRIIKDSVITYGIELSSWNTDCRYTAVLLK